MIKADFDARWRALSEEVLSEMKEWRLQHPRATLSEMEAALDERLARQRARMLEDMALASEVADLGQVPMEERPTCPHCGRPLGSRGKEERHLQTVGDQGLILKRSYGVCPTCKVGFFPLDDELGLVPGSLTPNLQASLTRLASWMPFERAVESLADLLRVQISEPTVRRRTEGWGAVYLAVQEEEVQRIEQELPPAPVGPDKMLLSVDGAMVPLVGGAWAEVKTLVLGVIDEPVWENGEWKVHASELSYFSRLMEAETFARAALGETHRRGVETAPQVVAVTDGAEWEQGFIDYHREDAVRVLDFPHAAEYVARMGTAVWGTETATAKEWLSKQLHTLKHEGPTDVLSELRTLVQNHPELPELSEPWAYLEKREAHMQYPACLAEGWPMGSGAVESGNKVVVEARLKGAGMHWARAHVNPMVALRGAMCSDRWQEARSQILTYQHQQAQRTRQLRRERHLAQPAPTPLCTETLPCTQVSEPAVEIVTLQYDSLANTHASDTSDSPTPRQPWRPAPDHPWRHSPVGKARYRQRSLEPLAKN